MPPSTSQIDNTSLQDQRNKLQAYCLAFGYELIEVFEEVESGKNAVNRPILNMALQRVAQDADGIIATKLDRIARNTRDVLALVEDVLQPQSKSLVLLNLQVDILQTVKYWTSRARS